MPFKKDKSTVIFLPRDAVAFFGNNPSRNVSQRLNKLLRSSSDDDLVPVIIPSPREVPPPRTDVPPIDPPKEVVEPIRLVWVQIRKDQRLRIQELAGGHIVMTEALQRIAEHYLVDRED
jgi:hypothetical protein